MEFTKEDINIGGSIFWISMILISLMGLMYLLIWSFHNNSVKGAVISLIFFGMIVSGILLSRLKVFDMASWGDNSLSFTLGFFMWVVLGKIFGQQSVLSVSKNYLLSTIAAELPQFIEFIVDNFIVPISEELFWMVGIPFALITIMKQIGKRFKLFDNVFFQTIIIILVCSTTFAIFHVGKAHTAFMIGAIIFRTIMIVLIYGEYQFNLLKGVNLVAGFSIGAHIANNLLDTGFGKAWIILKSEWIVAIIILTVFGLIFISAIERILKFIFGKTPTLEDFRK